MINARQLVKLGRKTKILELNDNLSVNDFYNITGFQSSSLHGKMSRIKLVIVDISKGKKNLSVVGSFNFKANEFNDLYKIVSKGSNQFNEYCKNRFGRNVYSIPKANPYKTINGNMIEVKTFNLSYESKLNVPKWKFEIITGQAMPNSDDFGYISKTYKELFKVNFLCDENELKEAFSYTRQYISLWEQYHFGEFLAYRSAFIDRARLNNYDESLKWNNNSAISSSKSVATNTNAEFALKNSKFNEHITNANLENNKSYICCSCGKKMTKISYERSLKNLSKALCNDCIKKQFSNK